MTFLFGENSENGGEASASKQALILNCDKWQTKHQNQCNFFAKDELSTLFHELYPVAGKLVDVCSVKGAVAGDGLSANVLVCFRTVMISEARQY